MSLAQRRVQLLTGLVIVAIVAIGAGISAFYGLTASRQAASPVIPGPVSNNSAARSIELGRQAWAAVHPADGSAPVAGNAAGTQAKVVIPFQAQGFVGSHPGLYEPANAAPTEREARADALQQQAMTMLNEGNVQRAQELSKQREAVLRGDDTTSVSSPALTEQQARAQELRRMGDDQLRTGNWQRAQQYYQQSQAALQGDPVLTEQRARAESLQKQGDDYLRMGDYQHAQQLYTQRDAALRGEAK